MKILGNFNLSKLKEGLSKTRNKIVEKITETFTQKAKFDVNILEDIEEVLITSDLGTTTTEKIIQKIRKLFLNEADRSLEKVKEVIASELVNILNESVNNPFNIEKIDSPFVILIVGVNGSGKTTSVGKLAYTFKNAGYKVLIGSADTFRAAANSQLEIWAEKAGVDIISNNSTKDPSAIAFETVKKAIDQKFDIVLIDTAGRLQNQKNLMEELSKIKRVIKNLLEHAPNEVFLVLDGTAGQNAVIQANDFSQYTDLTGLIISKLDGTAKGGVIFQLASEKKIPVRFIGVGEGIEDLQVFKPKEFVDALLNN
mgnify:CR=1 FL=1